MQIDIKATKIELTPELRSYIQEKMDMLDKYLGDTQMTGAHFEVELTTNHHQKGEIYRAEANLSMPNEMLRVEKTEVDMHKAIDKVKDHLAEMIKEHKEKLIDKKRGRA